MAKKPGKDKTKPPGHPSHSVDKPGQVINYIIFDDAQTLVHYGETLRHHVTTTSLNNIHEYNHQGRRNTWHEALVDDFGQTLTTGELEIYDVDPYP